MRYLSPPAEPASPGAERIGILLVNSGTPEAPTAAAVRAFLARFLSDPRVVELPRAVWLPLLWGVILPLRPARVARKYRRIWSAAGSPLRDLSQRLRDGVAAMLAQRMLAPLSVEVAMLYSPPDLAPALQARFGGEVRPADEVLVFNTGASQKYLEALPVDLPRIDKAIGFRQ